MATLIQSTPLSNSLAYFNGLFNRVNKVFSDHVQVTIDGLNFVWQNPYGLSPQQSLTVIQQSAATVGSTAQQTVGLWQAAAAYLNAIQHGCVSNTAVPSGYSLIWNPDGSGTVTQLVATAIVITPASDTLAHGTTLQFSAVVNDQYGTPLSPQPAVTWSAATGTIDASGNYTAPAAAGTDTVTATSGSLTATATVTIQ